MYNTATQKSPTSNNKCLFKQPDGALFYVVLGLGLQELKVRFQDRNIPRCLLLPSLLQFGVYPVLLHLFKPSETNTSRFKALMLQWFSLMLEATFSGLQGQKNRSLHLTVTAWRFTLRWHAPQMIDPLVHFCVCVCPTCHEVHTLNEFELLHSSHSGSELGWRRGRACLWIFVLKCQDHWSFLTESPIGCFSKSN